ncbi:Trp biosynthesis-associated membrane protein [Streptomyces solisilvae]|uniref:Trp biosynthesis-associated membrane protein n=1 Tax=Streptomyces malaysiensis TaxID=92644 RepID=UPI00369B20CD
MNAYRRPLSRRRRRRIGALAFATSALVLATAIPALAHTEVSATDSHALAKNVTLTFESKAEEASAEPKESSQGASSDDGSPWPAVAVIAGVCLVALAGGLVLFQQRRGSGSDE